MYYQLTMQFNLEEIDKAKKILDLAKELDVKRMDSLGPLPEMETFAWEENKKAPSQKNKATENEISSAKDWVPQEEVGMGPVKPEAVKPQTVEHSFEELRGACAEFKQTHGLEKLLAIFAQFGQKKLTDIPKERHQELWEVLHA
jgi:hypothetical protein